MELRALNTQNARLPDERTTKKRVLEEPDMQLMEMWFWRGKPAYGAAKK